MGQLLAILLAGRSSSVRTYLLRWGTLSAKSLERFPLKPIAGAGFIAIGTVNHLTQSLCRQGAENAESNSDELRRFVSRDGRPRELGDDPAQAQILHQRQRFGKPTPLCFASALLRPIASNIAHFHTVNADTASDHLPGFHLLFVIEHAYGLARDRARYTSFFICFLGRAFLSGAPGLGPAFGNNPAMGIPGRDQQNLETIRRAAPGKRAILNHQHTRRCTGHANHSTKLSRLTSTESSYQGKVCTLAHPRCGRWNTGGPQNTWVA